MARIAAKNAYFDRAGSVKRTASVARFTPRSEEEYAGGSETQRLSKARERYRKEGLIA